MTEHRVGSILDFKDGDKRLIAIGGIEIGVFQLGGTFYAWRNRCPHQGGPVCQGRIFKRVIENVDADGRVNGRAYDEYTRHIVCPWHGGEFDIRTGYHAGTNSLALVPIQTIVRDGEVFLRVD
jgi:nitrite reductase (NADH) small subunit